MVEIILNLVAVLSLVSIIVFALGVHNKLVENLLSGFLFLEVLVVIGSVYLPLQTRLAERFSQNVSAPILIVFIIFVGSFYFTSKRPNHYGLVLGVSVLGLTGALFRLISY